MTNYSIPKKAIDIITHFEGFKDKPYLCPAKVPTIGYGTTVYGGNLKVRMTDPKITKTQAVEYLKLHIKSDFIKIDYFLKTNKININENQLCALLSFAYNLGCKPIINKGRSLCDALITRDPIKVADAIMLYRFANKEEVTGLTRRRKCESHLYLTGEVRFDL
jgi:lysozyme